MVLAGTQRLYFWRLKGCRTVPPLCRAAGAGVSLLQGITLCRLSGLLGDLHPSGTLRVRSGWPQLATFLSAPGASSLEAGLVEGAPICAQSLGFVLVASVNFAGPVSRSALTVTRSFSFVNLKKLLRGAVANTARGVPEAGVKICRCVKVSYREWFGIGWTESEVGNQA